MVIIITTGKEKRTQQKTTHFNQSNKKAHRVLQTNDKTRTAHYSQQIGRYMLRFTVHLICTVFPLPLEVGVLIFPPIEPEPLRPNAFLLLLAATLKPVDARRGEGNFLISVLRTGDVGRGMA